MKLSSFSYIAALLLPSLVAAQLSGPVGPTTTRDSKRNKVCNVLNYGGIASKTSDIGPAIQSAYAACKSGGTVYVPPGDYGMSTWVSMSGGTGWAFQLDGVIYRTGTAGGNMIVVDKATDFEFYSSTSKGAIQGNGYIFHADNKYGPRIIRFVQTKNFSIHDVILVDAPAFHFVMDTCSNGEVYNMIIRGGNRGGLDGIDIWGSNIHVHDVEVSNKDECVDIKSPSSNMLIENINCNWSGGCAIGSLGENAAISNIIYRNIYTWQSNQMFMLKSNGGSGSVTNCQFLNFIGHSNAYSLNLNAYWSSQTVAAGSGVAYKNLTFSNWKGTCANGAQRAPIQVLCPSAVPCTDITIKDFAMWTETGSTALYKCENAFGNGACLGTGKVGAYASTITIKSQPTGYSAPPMPNRLSTLAITASVPIPTIPTTFFPAAKPASTLLGR
ncbi:Glycoside hydrolase family 28 protein [Venustampulla echinocandica]|uniref:Glycoside hydrolase family 28 protein n=1 Tax=Venustampulla echinocandica TaxID=2656787 RepID=A0A370TNF2_9HELO|nr:Glycoside hydrolase family 28 protein [Venustampulla echinocandica]RDL37055.1 Glycoside hydrolase family 28 protein [Venustampulla echinocandica]